jgi:hypothetical protein
MIKKDGRLYNRYDLETVKRKKKESDFFSVNYFSAIPVVVNWLCQQMKNKIIDKEISVEDFDSLVLPPDMVIALNEGDNFYKKHFEDNGLLPTGADTSSLNPLRFTVAVIYDRIWNKERRTEINLAVYHHLKKFIETNSAEPLATDPSIAGLSNWKAVIHSFDQQGEFFHAFIDTLPPVEIEKIFLQLLYKPDPANVLKDAECLEKPWTAETYNRAYLKKNDQYKTAKPWIYINELCKDSQYTAIDDELAMHICLVCRLDSSWIVKWIDSLYWPLLQAVGCQFIRDLEIAEQCIASVIAQQATIKTAPIHLLLVLLKRYGELLFEISRNLQTLDNADDKEWKDPELKESLQRVFAMLFKGEPVYLSDYFIAILDWVTAQHREPWLNHVNGASPLFTISVLYEVFINLLKEDAKHKHDIAAAIADNGVNWTSIEFLVSLFEEDESDDAYGKQVIAIIDNYLNSTDFTWNSGYQYNNTIVNQSFYLGYLLEKEPGADKAILDRIKTHWVKHEGWGYQDKSHDKPYRKQLFLLLAGISIAYTRYKKGEDLVARYLLIELVSLILQQMRVALYEAEQQRYTIPLRFVIHALAKFDDPQLSVFVREISSKIDSIEILTELMAATAEEMTAGKMQMDASFIAPAISKLNDNFWIIEEKKVYRQIPGRFAYYEQLRKSIMDFQAGLLHI